MDTLLLRSRQRCSLLFSLCNKPILAYAISYKYTYTCKYDGDRYRYIDIYRYRNIDIDTLIGNL